MSFCFICDAKLYRLHTQVCSGITPHTNTPYPEKIARMMGEEFVVIATPNDRMCMKCTSHLNHLDKCHKDAKLIKDALLRMMQEKYGVLTDDGDKNVNGHVMAKKKLEQGQRKVPSGPTVKVSPAVTTAVTPVKTPLKLLKTPPQQQQEQQQESADQMKIYKCGICTFQSKEEGHFRFHMLTHKNKTESKNPILNQAAAVTLTPVQQQRKRVYRCQICAKIFDIRINCIDHIQKDHQQNASTSIGERETEDSRPVTTKVMKPEPSKIQENDQQAETRMGVDKNQQNNNKDMVDIDMMLNDNTLTEENASIEEEKEMENAGIEEEKEMENSGIEEEKEMEDAGIEEEKEMENAGIEEEKEKEMENAAKERKSKALRKIQLQKKPNQREKKPKLAQEEVDKLEEEDTALPEQEKADQETPGNVETVVDEMWKRGNQNDNPPTNCGDTQSNA